MDDNISFVLTGSNRFELTRYVNNTNGKVVGHFSMDFERFSGTEAAANEYRQWLRNGGQHFFFSHAGMRDFIAGFIPKVFNTSTGIKNLPPEWNKFIGKVYSWEK